MSDAESKTEDNPEEDANEGSDDDDLLPEDFDEKNH